jgi:hypothetical protein
VVVGVFVLLESLVVIVQFFSSQREIPDLLTYPLQEVTNRVSGIEGPAVAADETAVSVRAEKCSSLSSDIYVNTSVQWVSVAPRGTVLTDVAGTQKISPGCRITTFTNPLPPIVREQTARLAELYPDLSCIKWSVTGIDTPLVPSATQPERWATESFCVLAPSP